MEILTFNNLRYYVKKNIIDIVPSAIRGMSKSKADGF